MRERRMIAFRDRMARGHTQSGTIESRMTFSFGAFHDPAHMGFRALRVINEDRVIPGAGLPAHGHRDMEIVTYVLSGALEHRDSLGNGATIRAGDVQRMTAGTGIVHSEFNPAASEPVHLLQIWIMPDQTGLEPGYEQKAFPLEERQGRLKLVAHPQGSDGALVIHQDARMFIANLLSGTSVAYTLAPGRGIWLQVARGIVALNGTEMREGDGAAIEEESGIAIDADTSAEVVMFDLA